MMSLHQTGPLHQITGIGRTTSLTCHLPRANVFLPSAKCISSPCKMYFFRLQNAFLPIAKCISSHYKKLSFIFYFEISLFHMQNVVLSRAKCISYPCKIYFFRLQNVPKCVPSQWKMFTPSLPYKLHLFAVIPCIHVFHVFLQFAEWLLCPCKMCFTPRNIYWRKN